jgi:hypothetical protein
VGFDDPDHTDTEEAETDHGSERKPRAYSQDGANTIATVSGSVSCMAGDSL